VARASSARNDVLLFAVSSGFFVKLVYVHRANLQRALARGTEIV
jgi:hypothetical protein